MSEALEVKTNLDISLKAQFGFMADFKFLERDTGSYLYITKGIGADNNVILKIGETKNIHSKLTQLLNYNEEVNIEIYKMPVSNIKAHPNLQNTIRFYEAALHTYLNEFHIVRELFSEKALLPAREFANKLAQVSFEEIINYINETT